MSFQNATIPAKKMLNLSIIFQLSYVALFIIVILVQSPLAMIFDPYSSTISPDFYIPYHSLFYMLIFTGIHLLFYFLLKNAIKTERSVKGLSIAGIIVFAALPIFLGFLMNIIVNLVFKFYSAMPSSAVIGGLNFINIFSSLAILSFVIAAGILAYYTWLSNPKNLDMAPPPPANDKNHYIDNSFYTDTSSNDNDFSM